MLNFPLFKLHEAYQKHHPAPIKDRFLSGAAQLGRCPCGKLFLTWPHSSPKAAWLPYSGQYAWSELTVCLEGPAKSVHILRDTVTLYELCALEPWHLPLINVIDLAHITLNTLLHWLYSTKPHQP